MAERKKLLILYTKDPEEVYNRKSAIGSYVYSLAELLSEAFEVTLNYKPFAKNEGIAKESSPANKSSSNLVKRLIPKRVKSLLRDRRHLSNLDQLRAKISALNTKFDVILEFYNFGSNVGLCLSNEYSCPLNLIYDGPILEEYEFFNGHASPIEKECQRREKLSFKRAKSIVVYSRPMIDFCCKNILNEREKYQVHQNIDFSRFRFLEEEKVSGEVLNLCFIGSFLKWHRVDLLLNVYAELLAEHPSQSMHLYLIGDGMEKNKMVQLSERINLRNYTFTGYLDGNELFEIQKKMDIGIMPSSNWYGAPNKIFEYGALKMAVVAPGTPTIRDVFSQTEVCYFENNDPVSLKKAIQNLLEDQQNLVRFQTALNNKINHHFSSEKTYKFYSSLLN